MFCSLENGDKIWENLCSAFFPSTSSKLEIKVSDNNWFLNNHKIDCLVNLGKVYSFLDKQIDSSDHGHDDEKFDKRERGLAFDGSRSRIFDSTVLSDAAEDCDDFSKLFSVLNIGLLQTDQEIRCATLSILQKLFRKLPEITKANCDSMFFNVMGTYNSSQCDILVSRCLDLSCNPHANEIECVEILRFYCCVMDQVKLISGNENFPHCVTVSIASVVRETLFLVLASDDDLKKRGSLVSLTLSLIPQRQLLKNRRSFKYGDAATVDVKTFPGIMVAKISASVLAEAILMDFPQISSSGAISVLINFILCCSNFRLSESLLATLVHSVNFPEGRAFVSPHNLLSFMSPLSLHPPKLNKSNATVEIKGFENIYLDDLSGGFEAQLFSAKLSLVSLLSSWPGVFGMGFCSSKRRPGFSSGISSLLNVLKVGHPQCRATVLEILFHIFAIPSQKSMFHGCTDSDTVQDDHIQYRLDEEFIIAEFNHWRDASSVAELCWRSLRRRSVDMAAFHRVFLMATFIDFGLIESLRDAHLSSFSSKQVQESLNNLQNSSAQMELNFRYSVSYLLSYIFQTYLPVLPLSYKEYFAHSGTSTVKVNENHDDIINCQNPEESNSLKTADTNEELFESSLPTRSNASSVTIDEAEVFAIRVIDSFLKLRLAQERGSVAGFSCGKKKHSSVFMEHLQSFYEHVSPYSADFSGVSIPKTNSLKLECHIMKLLYETHVFENVESSGDADLIIIGENSDSPFMSLSGTETLNGESGRGKREEHGSFTVGSNLKFPWAQNKPKSVDHIEDPFCGYDINDVVTNCANWNWVSICSCLRFFMYNCESGTSSASGMLQTKSLSFVKYLSMYFMPSNGLFSREAYRHLAPSHKNDMLKATYAAKIQAGNLLFRFLAAACAYSENYRSSNSANCMEDSNSYKEFSNVAETVFEDLALCIQYELGVSLRKRSSTVNPLRSISTALENSLQNSPICFSATSLPESMSQMYFIFLGGLPASSRRLIFGKFQFLEMFINCLLSGSNEVLCKLILTCMQYDIESGASENCQLLEVALRTSESRVVQLFALKFLSVLLSFWRETSPNVPWKEFGVKKVAWVVDMLYERVLSTDEHMRDIALTQLLELAQDSRCLPLMFAYERHLNLLNVEPENQNTEKLKENMAAKFLQLKALCIFSRYFNCIIDLQPSITARQRTFSKTNQFTTSVEDGTAKTDGLTVLMQEYNRVGCNSWLHLVLVEKWCQQNFCLMYAQYIDHITNKAFTRHVTDENGKFLRTSSESSAALKMVKSAPIPPHLFGELVRTPSGAKILFKLAGKTILDHVDQLICLSPEKRCLPYVKAGIWTIAHIASTVHGFNLLPKGVVALLVRMAERCLVYSVCGIATMALNLLCFEAQSTLTSLGWVPCTKIYSEREDEVMTTTTDTDLSFPVEDIEQATLVELESKINDICKDYLAMKSKEQRRLKRKAAIKLSAESVSDSREASHIESEDDDIGFIELSLAKRLPKNVIEATRKNCINSKAASEFNPDKLLIDSWYSISKSVVNHISDLGSKRLSVISTDKSECVAKFRFASVFKKRASVVLPMRMEKFVCGVAQNMRDEDECRDSRSRSTCSSSMSHSDSQRHTANSTEDREYSREREDSWKDLPGSDIRGDRTSISIADNFTPDTTPSHKPRYFTLRNDVNNASLRHGTSIDGVRFSVDSEEKGYSATRNTRTDSELSQIDSSGLNEVSSTPHEQSKCIQCKCFALIQSMTISNDIHVEVPSPSPKKSPSGGENETQSNDIYLPCNYREKVIFWTIKLCTFGALETAQAMKDFFQKYVYHKKENSSGSTTSHNHDCSSLNLIRVSKSQLICLYSDCLNFLKQNPSPMSSRFFIHSLFQPLITSQLAALQRGKMSV